MTLVMKFGGTSVGSPERFKDVAHLITHSAQSDERVVVVLSAMAGVTNGLLQSATLAVSGNLDAALDEYEGIRQKHLSLVSALFPKTSSSKELIANLDQYFGRIELALRGINYLGELSKRSLDLMGGFGELLSSIVLARFLQDEGKSASWVDARSFILTDDSFGRAIPLWNELIPKTKAALSPILQDSQCIITQGFIGSTKDGIPTTLGRGGSDYSASIIGVALDASEIQIWTDVDGMMTADPRVVKEACVLSEVSFAEASELAYFGAKVLHPSTIKPAVEKKIPVRILNTLKPTSRGTLITENPANTQSDTVCSIAAKKSITAIFIDTPNMLMAHGFLAKIFAVFDQHQTQIDLVATSEVSVAVTIDRTDALDAVVQDLSHLGEVRVRRDLAIVTVVGKQFREQSGIAGQIFSALGDVNIITISGGASDINVSFVVHEQDADRSVRLLHEEFFGAKVPIVSTDEIVSWIRNDRSR